VSSPLKPPLRPEFELGNDVNERREKPLPSPDVLRGVRPIDVALRPPSKLRDPPKLGVVLLWMGVRG
jgi:hypothetical protein